MNKLEDLFKYRNIVDCGYITPCWLWTGCKDKNGYGITRIGYTKTTAHRAAWIFTHGETNLKVCHKCDIPGCFNPDHLFEGTQSDNIKDAVSKGRHRSQLKTHCKNGHEFTEENTYIRNRNGKQERRCRTCTLLENDRSKLSTSLRS
jgi:hypothetical protein